MPGKPGEQKSHAGVGEVASARILIWMGGGTVTFVLSIAAMFGLYTVLANGPQTPQVPTPTPGPQLETHLFRSTDAPPQAPATPTPEGQYSRGAPIAQAMQIIAAKGARGFDALDAPTPETGR